MPSENFRDNIFGRKRIENFSHELFGIEINANENKAHYGTYITVGRSLSVLADRG